MEKLSHSALGHFAQSPAHYLHYLKMKEEGKEETTEAMEIGTAVHCAILQPEKFKEEYLSMPKLDRRTKEGKQKYEEYMALNKICLPEEDYNMVVAMKKAVDNCGPAMKVLQSVTQTERFLSWKDRETGYNMVGFVDGVGDNLLMDIKTMNDAEPKGFGPYAYRLGMHRQAAMYLEGFSAIGQPFHNFYFIAVEKEEPYGVSVHRCSEAFIEKGRQENRKLIDLFKLWHDMGRPNIGYEFGNPFGHYDLNLPSWAK